MTTIVLVIGHVHGIAVAFLVVAVVAVIAVVHAIVLFQRIQSPKPSLLLGKIFVWLTFSSFQLYPRIWSTKRDPQH